MFLLNVGFNNFLLLLLILKECANNPTFQHTHINHTQHPFIVAYAVHTQRNYSKIIAHNITVVLEHGIFQFVVLREV
jgi:hypothetical protein